MYYACVCVGFKIIIFILFYVTITHAKLTNVLKNAYLMFDVFINCFILSDVD